MAHMEVVGDEDDDGMDGAVLGSVMGQGGRRRLYRLPPRPSWRAGELAPGVQHPDEGMVPLAMVPQAGSPPGTFTATLPSITWQGQLQKPYRAERILATTVRTGTSAVGRCLGQIFVGVDFQGAVVAGFDLELLGAPTAFGTRMTLLQAPPGVLIQVLTTLSIGLTSTDTIYLFLGFLGRIIH